MLISISGAQGSGKSTVLNELKRIGFNVISRKTARSVLEEFDVKTLDEVYANPDLVVKWQNLILERKVLDEFEAYHSEELWFTERTYADLFTYACMAVGKNNSKSDWLNSYYDRCQECQHKYHIHSFYIFHHGNYTATNDGVRGVNPQYAAMIETSMYYFLKAMSRNALNENSITHYVPNFTDVESLVTEERVKKIATVSINKYLERINYHNPDTLNPDSMSRFST